MSALTGRAPVSAPQSVAGLLIAMVLTTLFTLSIGVATAAGAHHLPWLLAIPFLLAVLALPLAFAPGPGRWGRRTTRSELVLCFGLEAAAVLAMLATAASGLAAPALLFGAAQMLAVVIFTARVHTGR
ncbi:hypothetical protein HQQ80_13165 [Microbacteriaceae bacterium VKM Ac-2855]|nr:hypothetical protein [Microbacteriaceae bacterium VKM Ac-2855]